MKTIHRQAEAWRKKRIKLWNYGLHCGFSPIINQRDNVNILSFAPWLQPGEIKYNKQPGFSL